MSLRKAILFTTALSGALIGFGGVASAQSATVPQDEANEVVVTGIRRSIADAIETKREANSIVDVISAEDVGKLPDSNIADSLARLPGVTVDRQFGEGEQLSIAGTEPALNRVTIDGHSVASADWGGNPSDRSSRTFNYSLLSPTLIKQAIVYKTPEARLQEGAIGGTVDIVTRKPLDTDLKSGALAINAGGEYNDRANRGSFRGSALVNWKNDAETFGVTLSGNYDKEQLSRAGVAVYWYDFGSFLLRDAPGTATVNGKALSTLTAAERQSFSDSRYAMMIAREFFRQERQRIGLNGAVSVRPTEDLTLTATGMMIRGNYDNVSNSVYTAGYYGSRLQSATFTPGTDGQAGIVTSVTMAGVAAGQRGETGQLDTNYRRTRLKNDSVSLLLDWTPGDWSITGNLGWTRASGGKDPEYLLDFRTQMGFTQSAVGRDTVVNWTSPASDPTKWISTFQANGGQNITATDGRSFFGRQIGGIPLQSAFTNDSEVFGELNFKHDINIGPLTEILFGGRYVSHKNGNTTFSNAVFTNQNFTLADLDYFVQPQGLYDGLGVSGNGEPFATLGQSGILSTLQKYGTFTDERGLSKGDYWRVREKIAAGYIQANFELGKVRGNFGGRVVNTRDRSTFYLFSSGRDTLTTVNNSDTRFLPAANVIFQAGKDVVLRAAAAKVIARARYSDLAGSLSLDDATLSGSGGNPDLKPYAATNYGVSAEWYFGRSSFLSGEIFYRDISNYVGNKVQDGVEFTNTVTGRTLTYSISRPINGGKASVTGFSVSGNTALKWGFGIQANYTFADAVTPLATGLPFLSRNTVTIQPYYENGPFQARVSYNRRSAYFNRAGRVASKDYTDAYRQLDAQISYGITDQIQVSANASNLLDETYYQYSTDPRFPSNVYKNGRVFSIGATLRM